eukprot:6212189-Pleurochrysis_carterae.AAC.5
MIDSPDWESCVRCGIYVPALQSERRIIVVSQNWESPVHAAEWSTIYILQHGGLTTTVLVLLYCCSRIWRSDIPVHTSILRDDVTRQPRRLFWRAQMPARPFRALPDEQISQVQEAYNTCSFSGSLISSDLVTLATAPLFAEAVMGLSLVPAALAATLLAAAPQKHKLRLVLPGRAQGRRV